MRKSKHSFKRLLMSMTFATMCTTFVVNAYMQHTNTPCHTKFSDAVDGEIFSTQPSIQADAPMHCAKNNQQITWATWLFRKPDSMQFHYMDLLELLSREKR